MEWNQEKERERVRKSEMPPSKIVYTMINDCETLITPRVVVIFMFIVLLTIFLDQKIRHVFVWLLRMDIKESIIKMYTL